MNTRLANRFTSLRAMAIYIVAAQLILLCLGEGRGVFEGETSLVTVLAKLLALGAIAFLSTVAAFRFVRAACADTHSSSEAA